jgi:hypothetical protein
VLGDGLVETLQLVVAIKVEVVSGDNPKVETAEVTATLLGDTAEPQPQVGKTILSRVDKCPPRF